MSHTMNKVVHKEASSRFDAILLSGAYPKVEFTRTLTEGGGVIRGYNMTEYFQVWGRYTDLLHEKLKNANFPDGIFSNLRNKVFLTNLRMICDNITPELINAHEGRFKTWIG